MFDASQSPASQASHKLPSGRLDRAGVTALIRTPRGTHDQSRSANRPAVTSAAPDPLFGGPDRVCQKLLAVRGAPGFLDTLL